MIIYKTINLINNKIYIGKDKNNNPNYFGSGILLKYAIKKYGKKNFKKVILQKCSNIKELNESEINWIKKLNCLYPNGYNIAKGGEGGDTFSLNPNREKMIKNLSIKRTGNKNPFYGKHHDEKLKNSWSKLRKGRPANPQSLIQLKEYNKKTSKKVIIGDRVYDSINLASKILNIDRKTITYRIKSNNFLQYNWYKND